MALAGLWENWKSPAGEWVRSFTIVTCPPNELCGQIHDRMPVILPPATWPSWLGEETAEPEQLKALLAPYPAEDMKMRPVSLLGADRSKIFSICKPGHIRGGTAPPLVSVTGNPSRAGGHGKPWQTDSPNPGSGLSRLEPRMVHLPSVNDRHRRALHLRSSQPDVHPVAG